MTRRRMGARALALHALGAAALLGGFVGLLAAGQAAAEAFPWLAGLAGLALGGLGMGLARMSLR